MDLELVFVVVAAAIAGIVAWTVRGAQVRREEEGKGKIDRDAAVAKGAQPPSLYPRINLEKCIGCGNCVRACPELDVLAVIEAKAQVVNPGSCIGHGECARACPTDAIRLVIGTETRGVDIPVLKGDFETNVPGIYVVGELGGMGLIYNAMTQGLMCARGIARKPPAPIPGVHQLVIIGAGPAGLAAAVGAIESKLDFVVLDQESIGGTVLQYPRQKIVMTRPVELPLYGKIKVSSVKKEDLLEIWKDLIAKTGLEVRTGVRVESVVPSADGCFDVATSAGPLRAQRVILALGRRGSPRKLGIPGEDLAKVTYRLLEPENYTGAKCLVVGGGDAAVEAAIALGEAGAKVDLCHRGEQFDRIKKANQERLDAAGSTGKVTIRLKTKPLGIEPTRVHLDNGGTLDNDYVLVFAGGVLPSAFLAKAGVEVRTMKGEEHAPANL